MSNENLNATCSICGEKYHMCISCSEVQSFTPWRSIVDRINCYKIFLILKDYTNNTKPKEMAKSELNKCDLSELNAFIPEVKIVIENILKEDQKFKKIKASSGTDNIDASEK